jgi:hypothetical protein
MSRWRRINSAPRDGTQILLWHAATKSVSVGYWNNNFCEPWHITVLGEDANWSDYGGYNPVIEADAWLPLPPHPTAKWAFPEDRSKLPKRRGPKKPPEPTKSPRRPRKAQSGGLGIAEGPIASQNAAGGVASGKEGEPTT